jgi:hypothetical protein
VGTPRQFLADPAPYGFTQGGKIRGRALQHSPGRPIAATTPAVAATGDGELVGGIAMRSSRALNAETDAKEQSDRRGKNRWRLRLHVFYRLGLGRVPPEAL